jgi:hypothetical protein
MRRQGPHDNGVRAGQNGAVAPRRAGRPLPVRADEVIA